MNPPMIHCLATPPTADCPAAQLVAAACGDGTVAIWDLDKVWRLLLPAVMRTQAEHTSFGKPCHPSFAFPQRPAVLGCCIAICMVCMLASVLSSVHGVCVQSM